MLEERRVRAHYAARGCSETKTHDVDPLGIVYREGVVYLVCTREGWDGLRHILLHRFQRAELLDEATRCPRRLSLDRCAVKAPSVV